MIARPAPSPSPAPLPQGAGQPRVPSGHLAAAAREAVDVVELPAGGDDARSQPPALSVVVPTFNHRRLVLQLLEALRPQLGGDTELVVVDDGSADETFPALVARATELGVPGRIVRLRRNRGRSTARNVGVLHARAQTIAFTDSDCLPAPGWLAAGRAGLTPARVGVVQGPVAPAPGQRRPFFNHFIEIGRFDGTFSTCNVFYRVAALFDAGGFDPGIVYWEDVDLGWRVRRVGWEAAFAPSALVHHQVLPIAPLDWLRWPTHFAYMPAKVARYPEYRRFLFLRLWVHWYHAVFDLALLAIPLGVVVHRGCAALALPYLAVFPFRHGLRGRWPPAKAALHLAWDAISFAVLVWSSVRHRTLVL